MAEPFQSPESTDFAQLLAGRVAGHLVLARDRTESACELLPSLPTDYPIEARQQRWTLPVEEEWITQELNINLS
ncbi:MAG: hypothetical protein WB680_21290 [Candidatus Acidiferrales bacterium]